MTQENKEKVTGKRYPENGQKIVAENIKILYKLPKKYKNINTALSPVLREALLKILNFCKNNTPIIYEQKYCYFLASRWTITYKIRRKSTVSVSNRYLNYLCAMGLLRKVLQVGDHKININWEFLLETDYKRPINVVTIYRYTPEYLGKVEARTGRLLQAGITSGNISANMLRAAGLEDLAKETYPANNEFAFTKKQNELQQLRSVIGKQVAADGYTTKKKIKAGIKLSDGEVDKLFRIFKRQISTEYDYKRPTEAQMEQFGLINKKFIITKKES